MTKIAQYSTQLLRTYLSAELLATEFFGIVKCANLQRIFNSYIKLQPDLYFLELYEHLGEMCFL